MKIKELKKASILNGMLAILATLSRHKSVKVRKDIALFVGLDSLQLPPSQRLVDRLAVSLSK